MKPEEFIENNGDVNEKKMIFKSDIKIMEEVPLYKIYKKNKNFSKRFYRFDNINHCLHAQTKSLFKDEKICKNSFALTYLMQNIIVLFIDSFFDIINCEKNSFSHPDLEGLKKKLQKKFIHLVRFSF